MNNTLRLVLVVLAGLAIVGARTVDRHLQRVYRAPQLPAPRGSGRLAYAERQHPAAELVASPYRQRTYVLDLLPTYEPAATTVPPAPSLGTEPLL